MMALVTEHFKNHIIRYLVDQNEFLYLQPKDLKARAKELLNVTRPAAFIMHMSFIDLAKFGSPWVPTWFSIVRDPIERVNKSRNKYTTYLLFL